MREPFKLNPPPIYDEHFAATQRDDAVCAFCEDTGRAVDTEGASWPCPQRCPMPAAKQALRQQILAQIDKCAELAYAAGHHFAQHGKHAPSSLMAKADADATLVRLIEEYAAPGNDAMQMSAEKQDADGVPGALGENDRG